MPLPQDAACMLTSSSSARSRFFPTLEAVRGLAAIYVVAHHISSNLLGLQQTPVGQLFRFGAEAVLVFFLLSGFVISHATESNPLINWKKYFFLRIRRIYPVFIAALAVAFGINSYINLGQFDATSLIGNLVMMQDLANKPGVWIQPFAHNTPLWSLSYEMMFYLLYPAIMKFVPSRCQFASAIAVSWICVAINQFIPNPWCNFGAFFIVWWSGVEMARMIRNNVSFSLVNQLRIALPLFPPLFIYIYLAWDSAWKSSFAIYPIYQARFFGETIVILLLLPFLCNTPLRHLGQIKGLVWLGGFSYALYALHYPIVCDTPVFFQNSTTIDLLIKILILFLFAYILDRKIQIWINKKTSLMIR